MARIRLSKTHDKSEEQVNALVDKLERELCREFDLSSKRSNDKVILQRRGVDGQLTMDKQRVDIDIKLGMMASMFAPQLEAIVREKLDEYLG